MAHQRMGGDFPRLTWIGYGDLTKYISLSWSKEERCHHAAECLLESKGAHSTPGVTLINEEQVAWQTRRALISHGWFRFRLAWSRDSLWWPSKGYWNHNIIFLVSTGHESILPSWFTHNEPANKLFKVTSAFFGLDEGAWPEYLDIIASSLFQNLSLSGNAYLDENCKLTTIMFSLLCKKSNSSFPWIKKYKNIFISNTFFSFALM